MKRNGIGFLIFVILIVVNVVVSLLLTEQRNSIFWTGLLFLILSLLLAAITMGVSMKGRSSSFPLEISVISVSLLYVFTVFLINGLFGILLQVTLKAFLSIHIIGLAILGMLTLLILLAKSKITQQLDDTNRKLTEWHSLIYDYQTIKLKLTQLPEGSKKKLLPLMDAVLDDLKFADFSADRDAGEIDQTLKATAQSLSAEVDNLIEIQPEDVSALAESISEVRQLIKERNIRPIASHIRI